MPLLTSMLPVLLTGIAVLMTGILLTRAHNQSKGHALIESAVWGGSFFIAFSVEILALASI